uniref:Uncharacterized protein n=1 Tax=Triticum urartu TaxID=4572 RepID=A0A8R7RDB8_TRIUA
MDSKETVYFNEEAACARDAAGEALGAFDALLARVPPADADALRRSMGLKTPTDRPPPPATFSAGPHPPCTTPRLLDGLRQGRRRGEPQVRRSAGGDRGCHGQQGDGVLQRGGRLRARRGRRGPRRLRRAACARPARRRRRAPQVHGAQDGAAQGRAQAARGVVVAPGRSLMSASRSEISSFGNKSWRSLF